MTPYTDKEWLIDRKIKINNAETSCKYCGTLSSYENVPYICRKDINGRDCEGKCKYYKQETRQEKYLSFLVFIVIIIVVIIAICFY
jgi:predicted nucleic acid-binding Zn ribbon protein